MPVAQIYMDVAKAEYDGLDRAIVSPVYIRQCEPALAVCNNWSL